MGAIIYKPHCGRCGAIINQKVIYREVEEVIDKNCSYHFVDIDPYRCERCGEVFETIEISMPDVSKEKTDTW